MGEGRGGGARGASQEAGTAFCVQSRFDDIHTQRVDDFRWKFILVQDNSNAEGLWVFTANAVLERAPGYFN